MPDVFLSYNREDQAVARRFAEAFAAEGFEVWWDTTLRAGEAYDEITEKALKTAKAVVVLWSPRSVGSRWVRAEATLADRQKTMVPVTIEPCERPIMFELTQTAELAHWQGEPADKAWLAFLADVKRFVQRDGHVPQPDLASAPAASTPLKLSICVLPFSNMSADADQEYFADGISEDIITDLSKVSALSVIARNSAFAFKGKNVDVLQIARQLKVSHVLEGSVRKAGKRVRITAQLINGATNDHLWAERWDRDLEDIFALQDEMSQAIVAALKLKLLPEEKKLIEHRSTTSLEAYDKLLRARALYNSAVTAADIRSGIHEFRQALVIDPDFMEAYGEIAAAYTNYNIHAPHARRQSMVEMEALAREAMARAPHHWAAQLAKGVLLMARGDWAGAAAVFANSQASWPPSNTSISLCVHSLGAMGRVREALKVAEAARTVDPLSPLVSFYLIDALYVTGLTDEARVEYERALVLPGHHEAREHTALHQIWDTGDMARTRAQYRRFLDHQTVSTPVLAKVLDVIDQPAAALGLLRDAFDDPANQDGTRMMFLAWYAARFGDDELAVAALRRGFLDYAGGYPTAIWYPCLSRARRTPAFKAFAHDFGLDIYWRASGNWGDFARPVGDDDFEIIR